MRSNIKVFLLGLFLIAPVLFVIMIIVALVLRFFGSSDINKTILGIISLISTVMSFSLSFFIVKNLLNKQKETIQIQDDLALTKREVEEAMSEKTPKENLVLVDTFETYVAGTSHYQKQIKEAIKIEKDSGWIDLYNGVKNTEILEIGFYNEKYWELNEEKFECDLYIEEDNEYNNEAIKIEVNGYKIGYIPDKVLKIYYSKQKDGLLIHPLVVFRGGKYKELVNDDFGNDKVKIFNHPYSASIKIDFYNKELS